MELGRLSTLRDALIARMLSIDRGAGNRPLLSAKEAAKRLGITENYLRTHARSWAIEVPLSEGNVRFCPDAIDAMVKKRREFGRLPPRRVDDPLATRQR